MKDDYYGYIYVILDQKHNKVYVGQKKGRIEDSKNYYGSGNIIKNIQNNRGFYFLKKIVLGVCYSKEELTICETECKYFFGAFDRRYGYNIAVQDDGGDTITHHPENKRIRLLISLNVRLSKDNIPNNERRLLEYYLNEYELGLDKNLVLYAEWLQDKKDKEFIIKKESLLTIEERSTLFKNIWNNKSDDVKQQFIDKMIIINNSEGHKKKSRESRKSYEYKFLISSKIKNYYSQPGVKERKQLKTKEQWQKKGMKENYSKKMVEWHSNEENKLKHSNAARTPKSFEVENYINSLDDFFTIYDIMNKCECTYYIVDYFLKKEIKAGNILKGKSQGKIPIKYRRIK